MTRDEKRFLRREKINQFLHCNVLMDIQFFTLSDIKRNVRILEFGRYGEYLNIYSTEG